MTVIEHGDWQLYTPATLPEFAPMHALYARRVSDGTDWYPYAHDPANFQSNTAIMTLVNNVVATATTDPTALFPGNATVLELTDVPLDDLHTTWSRMVYDPATQTFSPPAPIDMTPPATNFEARLAALEAKLGGS